MRGGVQERPGVEPPCAQRPSGPTQSQVSALREGRVGNKKPTQKTHPKNPPKKTHLKNPPKKPTKNVFFGVF